MGSLALLPSFVCSVYVFSVSEITHLSFKLCFVLVNVLSVIANGRGEIGWDKYHSKCELGSWGSIAINTKMKDHKNVSYVCLS